jgi:flagellar hook-associated protein 3 FlgL
MEVRVSLSSMVSQAVTNSDNETALLSKLQQEASTGISLQQPSDNPTAFIAVLGDQNQSTLLTAQLSNIQSATTVLNDAVSATRDASNILAQGYQLALQGANSTNTNGSYQALAQQVNGLIQQLLDTANSKSGNQYLFGGTASQTAPFSITSTDSQGNPESISYQGAATTANVIIDPTESVPTLYTGSQVFQSYQRGPTTFTGSTGATPGAGTDSATGEGTLQVRHTATTYAAGSGIQAGASSAGGDTILGPPGAHQLTVIDTSGNGTAGTVSLDGGPAVAFTNSNTNLAVTGPTGQVVYVNTAAITHGFSGTVSISTSGTLSTDGGVTTVPIQYSADQQVTNSVTGGVTNVNSSGIHSPGDTSVEYGGTFDAFQSLITLRDTLLNTKNLSASQQAQALSSLAGDLQNAQNNVLQSTGEQSATLTQLASLQTTFQNVQLSVQQTTTNLQSADISQVVVQLQAQQNLLQLTMASTSEMLNATVSLLTWLH